MDKQVYTITTLAERWACSRVTIYKMIESGAIHAFRIGKNVRISADEVRRYENGVPNETQV